MSDFHMVVCVKAVPGSTEVKMDPKTNTIVRDGKQAVINPFDASALECALALKADFIGFGMDVRVTVVSMGIPATESLLRDCIARGADDALLLTDRAFAGADTLATSYALATAIKKIGDYDVIIGGRQAIDGDTAQVGPQIAEKLHLPQVTYAGEITKDGDTLTVKRMLEDGYMTIKVKTPCMITCIKELNTPRYLSVGGAFECYSKPLVTMTYETLKDHPLIDKSTIGLAGSPTNILTSFTPPQKGAGMMLEGADKATTDKLAGILAAKHII